MQIKIGPMVESAIGWHPTVITVSVRPNLKILRYIEHEDAQVEKLATSAENAAALDRVESRVEDPSSIGR